MIVKIVKKQIYEGKNEKIYVWKNDGPLAFISCI